MVCKRGRRLSAKDNERRRLALVDRDGTIIAERNYLAGPEGVELLPGAADAIAALHASGFAVALVTNQSGIARGLFQASDVERVNGRVSSLLAERGVSVDGIFVCPHHPNDGCDCRKPAPGLAEQAVERLGATTNGALVIGDKECDIGLGAAVGATSVLVRTGYGARTERDGNVWPDYVIDGLFDLPALLEFLRLERSQR